MTQPNTKTCNETRVVRSEILLPRHMNDKNTYYGGEMMAHFDSAGGHAVFNFTGKPSFTATIDTFVFLAPSHSGESVYMDAIVSGAGKSSVEVFVKMVSTDLRTNERKLCAYAFMTYVVAERNDPEFAMPALVAESEEEKSIVSGYEERRQQNLAKRSLTDTIRSTVSLQAVWE